MIKRKKSIQSIVSAILLILFLALIPLTFADHIDAASYNMHRDGEQSLLSLFHPNDARAALTSTEVGQRQDISPFMFLLAGGFGVSVVSAASMMVLRMGPEK
ncbi:MAG: hypothetical protein KDJ52_14980 [Anaerolineae bacterium]|nr:hypothetical protein [Anaerolineae bacterium]